MAMKLSLLLVLATTTLCVSSGGLAAQTLPTTQSEQHSDQILLTLPENVELKVLIEYISQRLGTNIYYDEQEVNQRVTIKAPTRIPEQSLLPLLESVLQMKGLVLVNAEQPGWKRIAPGNNLVASAQPATGGATTMPTTRPSAAVTQVFALQYVEPSKLDPVIKPFLTQPGGNSMSYAEQRLLIVTDYASNIHRISEMVRLLDQPLRQVSTQFLSVKHVDAQQLASQLTQLLAARQRAQASGTAGATAAAIEIAVETRTNQIVLIGLERDVREAIDLADQIDVPLELQTKMYDFKVASPERVDRMVKELIGPVESKRSYQSSIDPEANLLIVTATPQVHQQVEALKKTLDVGSAEQRNPVRFYKLANTTAAEVLQTIKAIETQEGLEQVSLDGDASPTTEPSALPPPATSPAGLSQAVPPAYPPAASHSQPQPAIRSLKTKEASVTADTNTNTIIVVARPAIQQVYEELIKRLDHRRPQVLIECTIVTLDTTSSYSVGVEVSSRGGAGSTDIITFSSFGLSSVGKTRGTDTQQADLGQLTLRPGTGFNGTIIASDLADIVLKALLHSGRADVVSAPRILVNDNTAGTLASVDEAPFTSVNASDTVATTSFGGYATAGTTITLTPHISEADYLQLEYSIALNSFSGSGSAGIPPPRQSNTITSKVTIPDGSTIIVGGLNRKNYTKTVDAIPILGQIPILEHLFSSHSTNNHISTLFVFVRPVILRDDQFQDLKYFSARDVQAAGLEGDYPPSEPMLVQ